MADVAAHKQETFYVGGEYVQDEGHFMQGQMYVQRLLPGTHEEPKPFPLIFIHGGTRTGNDWLTKPDGNPGWASYFLSQRYEVYLVDLPFRGRSPWLPWNKRMIAYSAEQIQKMFTASNQYDIWPQAKLHTQWPGTGLMGEPIFDKFYASTIQQVGDPLANETAAQAACASLLDRINRPAVLVGHSQGGSIPWLAADVRPQLVKMIVSLEPTGPPFFKGTEKMSAGASYGISHAPITYEPPVKDPAVELVRTTIKSTSPLVTDGTLQAESPPPHRLVNIQGIPVLVVTAPASYHARYDAHTVEFLRQAGVKTEHLKLEDEGISGNGHMFFMEKNSDEVAAAVENWISKTAHLG